ncbi:transcription antitermination factor NusB [bacterium]|nr:transcription antitermination factor NusB [candidate division CSSED10-310 bacterium]
MGKRRNGREIALQILYKLDIDKDLTNKESVEAFETTVVELLDYLKASNGERDLAYMLTLGVFQNFEKIDQDIDAAVENWSMDRLSLIDRNILRLAVYELNYVKDVPYKTVINEAIEIAKKFSSSQSSKFVNGVLDCIYRFKKPADISKEGSLYLE